MNARQIVILLGIVVVLVVAIVLKQLSPPREVQTEVYTDIGISFLPEDIIRILISFREETGEDKQVVLARDDGTWQVASFYRARAEESAVKDILRMFSSLEGEVRASSKGAFSDFLIEDSTGVHIDMEEKDGQRHRVVVGTKPSVEEGGFVRLADSEKTYFVYENLLFQIGFREDAERAKLNHKYFCNRHFAHFDENALGSVTIRSLEGEHPVERCGIVCTVEKETNEKRWSFAREGSPFDIDGSKIEKWLKTIKQRIALDVVGVEPDSDYGLSTPRWEFIAEAEAGETAHLIAGGFKDEERGSRYLQQKGTNVSFVISRHVFDLLDKDDSHFFVDNPLKISEELEEITVHSPEGEKRYLRRVKGAEGKEEAAEEEKGGEDQEKTGQWFLAGDERPLDDAGIKPLLAALKDFKVERLLLDEQDAVSGLLKPKSWFSVKMTGEEPVVIDIGNPLDEAKKEYPARRRGSPVAFIISVSTYESIFHE